MKGKMMAFALAGALFAGTVCSYAQALEIKIDYGKTRPSRTVTVALEKGDTALMALMKAAPVRTDPVGEYVFVTAIDGVEGKRGDIAWYYTLDGKSAKNLAYRQTLDADVKSMCWALTRDVCSEKVDGPKAQ
jgi:hypothetical protein